MSPQDVTGRFDRTSCEFMLEVHGKAQRSTRARPAWIQTPTINPRAAYATIPNGNRCMNTHTT